MAKITRATQKVFGENAGLNEIGVFGSLAAGSPAYATTPAQVQSLSNYLQGWFGAVLGSNSPAIEDMNAVHFLFARQLAYLMQTGVPEYDAATTYYIGSYCSYVGRIYISLTDTNLNNLPTNASFWSPYDSNPTGVVIPFAGSTCPANYLFCDGTAVSRTTYASLFALVGVIYGVGDGSTTFNIPNMQRRVPMGAGGAGTGIIGNSLAATGGSETHVMSGSELPAHSHAFTSTLVGNTTTNNQGLIGGSNDTNFGPSTTPGNVTISTSGLSDPFTLIQPSLILNYIIRT